MDSMIECGRFAEFINEFVKMQNEETENDTLWQFYLHHAFIDIGFNEFKAKLEEGQKKPDASELETTVRKSKNILDGFDPISDTSGIE